MRQKLQTLNDFIAADPDIMDSAVLIPTGVTALDSAALKLAIVRRCGDVEPYYQNHDEFVSFSRLWFSTHDFLFNHAVKIWEATYNPIENYDRTETEEIEDTKNTTEDRSETNSGMDELDETVTNEHYTKGFDSATYLEADKDTADTDSTTRYGRVIDRDADIDERGSRTREARIHGNIGVTTAQQMLEAEMELARRFWVYDYIASAYETDNFISVYRSYFGGEQWNT